MDKMIITSNSDRLDTLKYWNIIKNVKDEIKIRLITLLSESLTKSVNGSKTYMATSTDEFINKFYGAWKGPESDSQIIAMINHGKTSKDPVSFD